MSCSGFICVVACIGIPFLWKAQSPCSLWVDPTVLTRHLWVASWGVSSHLLPIVNQAAVQSLIWNLNLGVLCRENYLLSLESSYRLYIGKRMQEFLKTGNRSCSPVAAVATCCGISRCSPTWRCLSQVSWRRLSDVLTCAGARDLCALFPAVWLASSLLLWLGSRLSWAVHLEALKLCLHLALFPRHYSVENRV